MPGFVFFQRAAQGVAQGRLKFWIIIILLHQFLNAQRLADDLVGGQVTTALHFLANEFFLMRRERHVHVGSLKLDGNTVKRIKRWLPGACFSSPTSTNPQHFS